MRSDEQTAHFGAALAAFLAAGDALLLRGDLGAGKSVLARGIARGLGVEGPMPSPTFTLVLPHEGAKFPVYHFDLYRLADMDEFEVAGLDEMIDADGVCLIEWPLKGLVPRSRIECLIERGPSEDERLICLDASHFGREKELGKALEAWEVDEG